VKHLLVCDEYPPAPGAGIGTYARHISTLLAERGEIVHVVAPLVAGTAATEEELEGRLIVHRIPSQAGGAGADNGYLSEEDLNIARRLEEGLPSLGFAWGAGVLCERLVEQEGIDVVEAQEYGALLYFFQLRRALGMGPARRPPTVVHLHSPTEFIARYNGWDVHSPQISLRKRLEGFSIVSADALLCPSNFLAGEAARRYRVDRRSIEVMPYPSGGGTFLDRPPNVWSGGTIAFIGRMEPRKGAIEWMDAALEVAGERSGLVFEFVGPDRPYRNGETVLQTLQQRVPPGLGASFRFHGEKRRADVASVLVRARIAVVPSLWDNYPNSCLEAMGSGLPVLATRQGGMAEMITDGESGWLAAAPTPAGLAAGLRRALEESPERLAAMGARAARDIGKLCDNDTIVARQLAFRRALADAGAGRSLRLVTQRRDDDPEAGPPGRNPRSTGGIAVVVTAAGDDQAIGRTLDSVERLTPGASGVAVVWDPSGIDEPVSRPDENGRSHWIRLERRPDQFAAARNEAVDALLARDPAIAGFAFVASGVGIAGDFVSVMQGVLDACSRVGLISAWSLGPAGLSQAAPGPSFPYQWVRDEAARFSVIRTEAFKEAGGFTPALAHGYEAWDLHNAVMLAGWDAVTAPVVLADTGGVADSSPVDGHVQGVMRELVLDRLNEMSPSEVGEILLLAEAELRFPFTPAPSRRERIQHRVEVALMKNLPAPAVSFLQEVKRRLRIPSVR